MSKSETKSITGITIPFPSARVMGELYRKALPYVGRLLPKLLAATTILLLSAIFALSLIARERGLNLKLDIGGFHIAIDVPAPLYEQPLVVSTATGAKLTYKTKKTTDIVVSKGINGKPIVSEKLVGSNIHPVSFEYPLTSDSAQASIYTITANDSKSYVAVSGSLASSELKGEGAFVDCIAAYTNTYRIPVIFNEVPDAKMKWDFSNLNFKDALSPFQSLGAKASIQGTTVRMVFDKSPD